MTIWTNDLDYKDWKDDLEAEYPDKDGYSENDRMSLMYEINDEYLEDEKMNLDKELGRPIVMSGSLGLWDRRRTGFKFLKGTNLNDVFTGTVGDITTWYVEDGDIKCTDAHHDGTNYYVYRVLKSGVTEDDFYDYACVDPNAFDKYAEKLGHYVYEKYGVTA